jgi:hypothetical protein
MKNLINSKAPIEIPQCPPIEEEKSVFSNLDSGSLFNSSNDDMLKSLFHTSFSSDRTK